MQCKTFSFPPPAALEISKGPPDIAIRVPSAFSSQYEVILLCSLFCATFCVPFHKALPCKFACLRHLTASTLASMVHETDILRTYERYSEHCWSCFVKTVYSLQTLAGRYRVTSEGVQGVDSQRSTFFHTYFLRCSPEGIESAGGALVITLGSLRCHVRKCGTERSPVSGNGE